MALLISNIKFRNSRNNQLLHLIRSRCVISEQGTTTYDFENLQRDIVINFVLGKTKISTENLRKQFQFHQRKHVSSTMNLSILDLSTLSHDVHDEYKVYFWEGFRIFYLAPGACIRKENFDVNNIF